MEGLPWRWLCMATLASCLLPATGAFGADAGSLLAPPEARAWLARIQAAASTGNYQGTIVFSTGATMSSSRVWHYSSGGQTWEHLEALDGRQERIVRHNDAVHTLWPQSRVAVVERRDALTAWSTTPQRVEPQALDQYDLRREGTSRVAGREAEVLLLEPHDSLRYAQRLWADAQSGLLLRADVLGGGPSRTVLESTAFSEVDIAAKASPEGIAQTLQVLRRLDGYRVLRPPQQQTSLQAEGWTLGWLPAGFRPVGSVRRGIGIVGDESPVLQAVYSDGLTVVSLFVELFNAERHKSEQQAQQGATATWMLRRGEHWITAVGDVPMATLRQFAEALERRKP